MKNLIIVLLATYIICTSGIFVEVSTALYFGVFIFCALCVFCTDWFIEERRKK